jgi:hypothetical protein
MAQQQERDEIMEYVLLCSSSNGSEEDAQELMANLKKYTGVKTPRQLYILGKQEVDILLNEGNITHAQHLQLTNLIRWMRTYVTQDGKQGKSADLTKSLEEWRQVMTRDTFEEFIGSGEIHTPPPHVPEPKSTSKKRDLPDPPGCHINECNTHVPTLMDDPMPIIPARTTDPGKDKPNVPGIWKKQIQKEVPTPAPTTLAPEEIMKARPTPSPTTVMSHPTWEYWCHTSTPLRGAYPSYDDDYCKSNNPPTMAAPTPTSASDICIIGDPPYQLRGGYITSTICKAKSNPHSIPRHFLDQSQIQTKGSVRNMF